MELSQVLHQHVKSAVPPLVVMITHRGGCLGKAGSFRSGLMCQLHTKSKHAKFMRRNRNRFKGDAPELLTGNRDASFAPSHQRQCETDERCSSFLNDVNYATWLHDFRGSERATDVHRRAAKQLSNRRRFATDSLSTHGLCDTVLTTETFNTLPEKLS